MASPGRNDPIGDADADANDDAVAVAAAAAAAAAHADADPEPPLNLESVAASANMIRRFGRAAPNLSPMLSQSSNDNSVVSLPGGFRQLGIRLSKLNNEGYLESLENVNKGNEGSVLDHILGFLPCNPLLPGSINLKVKQLLNKTLLKRVTMIGQLRVSLLRKRE